MWAAFAALRNSHHPKFSIIKVFWMNPKQPLGRWAKLIDQLVVTSSQDKIVESLRQPSEPTVLAFLNAHAANLAWSQPQFSEDLAAADVLLRDGIGIKILLMLLGREPGANLNGTDFIPTLLASLQKVSRVAVYGTKEPYLSRAGRQIESLGPTVVDMADGFQNADFYCLRVQQTVPDVVLLAMGMPRQERIARRIKESTSLPVLIINGGAIVDFLGGGVRRAPQWIILAGMEWFFRLLQEPRRLWKRYVIGNFLFLWRAVLYRALHCK